MIFVPREPPHKLILALYKITTRFVEASQNIGAHLFLASFCFLTPCVEFPDVS